MVHTIVWVKVILLIASFIMFMIALILLAIYGDDYIGWYIWFLMSVALVFLLIVIVLEFVVPKDFCVNNIISPIGYEQQQTLSQYGVDDFGRSTGQYLSPPTSVAPISSSSQYALTTNTQNTSSRMSNVASNGSYQDVGETGMSPRYSSGFNNCPPGCSAVKPSLRSNAQTSLRSSRKDLDFLNRFD